MIDWINYLEIDSKYANDEDKNKVLKFIFLWLKCNDYYNNEYHDICGDKNKFLEFKENVKIQQKYQQYWEIFLTEFEAIKPDRQPKCYVINMQNNNKVYFYRYDKSKLEDLLKVVYQIRCNLFHGDKEPYSENIKFVSWAYDCLNALTKDTIFRGQ